jgi:two-component system OmpR family response regulator
MARVGLCEDDPAIRRVVMKSMQLAGHEVVVAHNGGEAVRLFGDDHAIDALILDIGLPDGDGAEVARDIAERIGHRPTLYVSGWSDDFWQLSDAPGRWRVRQKPIPIPWLLDTVRWLTDGGDLPPG